MAESSEDAEGLTDFAADALGGNDAEEFEVTVGTDPAEVILRRAEALPASVVCMSTHGRGRVIGGVIGSVARSVLQSCTKPAIAVGPLADRPGAAVGRPRRRPANWPEPLSAGGVVVCVDGSPDSEQAIPEAARWAAALGMGTTVLTVAEDVPSGADGRRPNRFGPEDPQRYVNGLADRWHDAAPGIVGVVVYDPIGVASGVRAYMATHPVGLVALTAHARSGLQRLRLGATSAEIVATSTAPGLVVPLTNGE